MKVCFLPKTNLGKWALILFVSTIVLMIVFYSIIAIFHPKGTGTFFGTPELAVPLLLAWAASAAAFILGTMSIIKSQSKSILIFVIVIITFLTSLWGVLEAVGSH